MLLSRFSQLWCACKEVSVEFEPMTFAIPGSLMAIFFIFVTNLLNLYHRSNLAHV